MDWRESMKKDETPPPFPSHTNQKFTSVFLIPWKINISKLPKLVHVPTVSNLDILTVQVSFQTLPQLTKHIACSKAWLTGRNCDRIVFRNLPGGLIGCWKKRPLGTAAFFACSSMTKAVVATLPSLITVKKSLRLLVGQPWARQSWQIDFNTELSIMMLWPTNSRQGEGGKKAVVALKINWVIKPNPFFPPYCTVAALELAEWNGLLLGLFPSDLPGTIDSSKLLNGPGQEQNKEVWIKRKNSHSQVSENSWQRKQKACLNIVQLKQIA